MFIKNSLFLSILVVHVNEVATSCAQAGNKLDGCTAVGEGNESPREGHNVLQNGNGGTTEDS